MCVCVFMCVFVISQLVLCPTTHQVGNDDSNDEISKHECSDCYEDHQIHRTDLKVSALLVENRGIRGG